MIVYGAPRLARPGLYDRGDGYLLERSRRLIPRRAVVAAPRGSAVSAASILVALDMDVPGFLADQAAEELLTGEPTAMAMPAGA